MTGAGVTGAMGGIPRPTTFIARLTMSTFMARLTTSTFMARLAPLRRRRLRLLPSDSDLGFRFLGWGGEEFKSAQFRHWSLLAPLEVSLANLFLLLAIF